MYWTAIISFLTWPLLIAIVWFLVRFILKKYQHSLEKMEDH